MIETLLLICALATPHRACTVDTADQVIQGPEAISELECALHGQAYLAAGAMADYLDGAHYLKVSCSRRARRA